MRCQNCNTELKEIKTKIQDAETPVTSYQCSKCGYFDFEGVSINKAIKEIKTIETFKEFTKDSELTEEDALSFGREVSEKAAKRHRNK